jgi:hypothetical protein
MFDRTLKYQKIVGCVAQSEQRTANLIVWSLELADRFFVMVDGALPEGNNAPYVDLWAQVRQQGLPTADPSALDGDVILAAQTLITKQQRQQEIIIATTKVGHLSRFTIAQDWQTIN